MQIDFSAAFDRVNHLGSIGSALWVLKVLSNRSQHIMVDGCWSKLVDVASGVPQGSVLGPLFLLLYISELFSILENKVMGYADDHFDGCYIP